jgi:hypothetical protein
MSVGELRELDDGVDLLQISRGKGVRERRLIKVKRIEGRRETGDHRGWRIWPETPADTRSYGEQSGQPGGTVWRGRKGKRRGGLGPFIGMGRGRITQG